MIGQRARGKKGSVTVEACLALPVFLIFFYLLLFFTKIACLNIILDHAVKGTVQQLAAVSYPLRFLNEQIDLKSAAGTQTPNFLLADFSEGKSRFQGELAESLLLSLFSGELGKPGLGDIWDLLTTGQNGASYNLAEGALLDALHEPYLAFKGVGQYYLFQNILAQKLTGNLGAQNKLEILLAELPQSNVEYQYKKAGGWYQEYALMPDRDFTQDDVLLLLEYRAVLPIPWGSKKEIVLRHLAVERAWLYGSNGIYAADRMAEGIDFAQYRQEIPGNTGEGNERPPDKEETEYVYLCRSPTEVYHRFRDCKYIYDKTGVRRISLKEAEERGLRPHVGCPELFK